MYLVALGSSSSIEDSIRSPPENSPGNKKDISFSGRSARLLNVIQVANPIKVLTPACDVKLMEHSFAFSYGHPFVGMYKPPDCFYNRVALTLTVTSSGRQFDRLALMCRCRG
jgi:hypothetical protein